MKESLSGRQLGPYRILRKLGSGGMGDVYYAQHDLLEREIALKILSPTLVEEDRPFVDRFFIEAKAAASVNHPNVVDVLNAGEADGLYFIAMEFVRGLSLRDLMKEQSPLSVEDALNLVIQVVHGLQAAYRKDIIHRDIKPANIMLTHEGVVKIADFGLAKNLGVDAGLTRTGHVIGTPAYISPEQVRGETTDFLSDLYSLGISFFEMVTGRRPFKSETVFGLLKMHCEAPLPDPRDLNPQVPPIVSAIIRKMMAKKKRDRYVSYDELLIDLEERALSAGAESERPFSTLSVHINRSVQRFEASVHDLPPPAVQAKASRTPATEIKGRTPSASSSRRRKAASRRKGNPLLYILLLLPVAAIPIVALLIVGMKGPSQDEAPHDAPPPPVEPVKPSGKTPKPPKTRPFDEFVVQAEEAWKSRQGPAQSLRIWRMALDAAETDDERKLAMTRVNFFSALVEQSKKQEKDNPLFDLPDAPPFERKAELAVVRALVWLRNHQNENGLWSVTDFSRHCSGSPCRGKGSTAEYDTGASGLALLAFLLSGNSPRRGNFTQTAQKAVQGLCAIQRRDGCIGEIIGDGHWIYNHLIASRAVLEAFHAVGDADLGNHARAALAFTLKCRNPGAGWRYGCQPGDNDTSVSSWALLSLLDARRAGIEPPAKAFRDGNHLLNALTSGGTWRTGYSTRGDKGARLAAAREFRAQEAMTAAAMAIRLGLGYSTRDRCIQKAAGLILGKLPVWSEASLTIDLYFWYYGTLAMHRFGGPHWLQWKNALLTALLPAQNTDENSCANGSWPPAGAWGKAGGRVYSTALCALMLAEVYRYREWEGD